MCTWISREFGVPLTIIRICSTYGPEGGAPADRLERMLRGRPIRLHPDAPNNFNPIYEDDYVELGVRALEVADVSACRRQLGRQRDGQRRGVLRLHGRARRAWRPTSCTTASVHTALWPDVTRMHEVLGRTKVPWRVGFRRMIEARHPELPLEDAS